MSIFSQGYNSPKPSQKTLDTERACCYSTCTLERRSALTVCTSEVEQLVEGTTDELFSMRQYELLFILPGTLAENEATEAAKAVEATLSENGATELSVADKGKTRLAYPIKHIRYGYFFVASFDAAPENVPVIEKKLGLMSQLLRALLTKQNPKAKPVEQIVAIQNVVGTKQSKQQATTPKPKRTKKTEEPASKKVVEKKDTAEEKEDQKESKKDEKITIEEIDQKLDKLLGDDIASV